MSVVKNIPLVLYTHIQSPNWKKMATHMEMIQTIENAIYLKWKNQRGGHYQNVQIADIILLYSS